MTQRVSISAISLPEDPGRVLHLDVIALRVGALLGGQEIEPVELGRREDGHFDLRDGRHRFLAHVIAGHSTVVADVAEEG